MVSDTNYRLVWALLLSAGLASPAHAAGLLAGAAAVDITPRKLPVRTAGNLTLTIADRVVDPLAVKALVLDDGAVRIAFAVIDSCMVDREAIDQAKLAASHVTDIPVENMLVSSTHTHSAPAAYGCHGNDAHLDYRAWLVTRIAEAIEKAWSNRVPARAGWGKSDLATYVHCRHWLMKPGKAIHPDPRFTGRAKDEVMMNPGFDNADKVRQMGPVDPAVTVLCIQTREGAPLAVLCNYSTHYAGAEPISADYFGELGRVLAKELGVEARDPPFVALMTNGTSGDANCIDFTKADWKVDMLSVAKAVAGAALEVMKGMSFVDDVPLAAVERRVSIGVRLPSKEDVAAAREYLAKNVVDRPTRTWEENYARETTLMADWPATVEIKLQGLRVGDLGIGAIPCETFGSTGLGIKKASAFPLTMVIGLANGYNGYLPPPDQHETGGYTTWRARTSYLEVGAEPRIARAVVELLGEARKKASGGRR